MINSSKNLVLLVILRIELYFCFLKIEAMKKVIFTLIFNDVDESHLGKDVFLVPRYWCKIHHAEGNIVYPRKLGYKELPNQHRGINLIPLKTYLKRSRKSYLVSALIYLLCNAWKIDVLMQFHFSDNTLYLGNLFKLLHPNGLLYIKCDGEYWLDNVLEIAQSNHGFRATIKRFLYERLLRKANLVSIETETGYEKLQTKLYFGISLKEKSCLLENGFDEDLLKEQSINELTFGEIIPQDDYLSLRNAIQSVIDKNMDLLKKNIQKEDVSYEILINNAFKE